MDNQQVSEAELGWLAGFMDGEGYIGLRVEYHKGQDMVYIRAEMSIVNYDRAMIQKAVDIGQKLDVNFYVRARPIKNRRVDTVYRVETRSQAKLVRLLKCILPYMTGEKQRRAALVLEFCKSRIEQPEINRHHILGLTGLQGNGNSKPYTRKQIAIFQQVQPMLRRGPKTSETIRAMQREIDELTKFIEAHREEVEVQIGMTIEAFNAL